LIRPTLLRFARRTPRTSECFRFGPYEVSERGSFPVAGGMCPSVSSVKCVAIRTSLLERFFLIPKKHSNCDQAEIGCGGDSLGSPAFLSFSFYTVFFVDDTFSRLSFSYAPIPSASLPAEREDYPGEFFSPPLSTTNARPSPHFSQEERNPTIPSQKGEVCFFPPFPSTVADVPLSLFLQSLSFLIDSQEVRNRMTSATPAIRVSKG